MITKYFFLLILILIYSLSFCQNDSIINDKQVYDPCVVIIFDFQFDTDSVLIYANNVLVFNDTISTVDIVEEGEVWKHYPALELNVFCKEQNKKNILDIVFYNNENHKYEILYEEKFPTYYPNIELLSLEINPYKDGKFLYIDKRDRLKYEIRKEKMMMHH